ncbi:hypothetical protein CYMTET_42117 [Cymbomonas tetramitiformis]|uniref:Uncharacterized protein n=1 Tax=Cymbomonas tetramitiformis TaxID=36881 RepID=A0AAE0C6P4_9CHLO|nr:hypothetical protein CYMTET_42117 [Cymbomonas tetramitiformis]
MGLTDQEDHRFLWRSLLHDSDDYDDDQPSFVELLDKKEPAIFVSWAIAVVSLVLSTRMFLAYRTSFQHCNVDMRVFRYQIIASLAMVCVTSSSISVIYVRTSELWTAILHAYESYCLYHFYYMILDLGGGEAAIIRSLEDKPPAHLYKYPPFCCCPCFLKTFRFSNEVTRYCQRAVTQFLVLQPAMSVFEVMVLVANNNTLHDSHAFVYTIRAITTISTAFAMHGLVVMWRSTDALLARYNLTIKFLAMKSAIFILSVQGNVILVMVYTGLVPTLAPLDKPGTVSFLANVLLCIEGPILLWRSTKAFIPEECRNEEIVSVEMTSFCQLCATRLKHNVQGWEHNKLALQGDVEVPQPLGMEPQTEDEDIQLSQ